STAYPRNRPAPRAAALGLPRDRATNATAKAASTQSPVNSRSFSRAGRPVRATSPGTRASRATPSAPDQGAARVFQDSGQVRQEAGTELSIDQAAVERDRQLGGPARHDLLAAVGRGDDPRLAAHGAEGDDRGLTRVDDRRAGVDPEDADVGDRDGTTRHLSRLRPARASGLDQVGHGLGELP